MKESWKEVPHVYLAHGPGVWAKGQTVIEAVQKIRDMGCKAHPREIRLMIVEPRAFIDDMGRLIYHRHNEAQMNGRCPRCDHEGITLYEDMEGFSPAWVGL